MNDTVKAAIDSELANLEAVSKHATEPFGYGSDISGDYDLDPYMAEVSGNVTLALAQAVIRRLDCPRGALPDDKDYGIDLRSYVNAGVTDEDVRSLAGQIRGELSKDDRIDSLTVTVSPSSDASSISIEIAIVPIDSEIGGFTLTLSASSASVLLEEIRSAL